jgi:hypothetical protein
MTIVVSRIRRRRDPSIYAKEKKASAEEWRGRGR